jgi:MGT family glycosyltransferase
LRAGHEVAFASGRDITARIERAGFPAFSVGPSDAWPRTPGPPKPEELVPWVWEELYAGPPAAERLADLVALCETWRPRIIVRENAELAGAIAAEAVGVPHAVIQNGNIGILEQLRHSRLAAQLDAMRARYGVAADPELAMLLRYLLLLPIPPSFHDSALPLPPTARFIQPVTFDVTGDERLPAWVAALPPRPIAYMTLGTVFNSRTELFRTVIDAFRDEPATLIITVGRNQNPCDLEPHPDNVFIERYIPQSLLLPRCAVMINIAGMNSLRSAFEHGVPLLLLPLVAEHALNAARCQALGLARVLDPDTVTSEAVRTGLREVLSDPTYRANAARVRCEAAAQPGPDDVVPDLEQLVAENSVAL